MSGPVPKRSDQRRRRNRTGPDQVAAGPPVVDPPALRDGIHPLARAWYDALAQSGQARFYEASDWMTAQVIAEAIEDYALTRRASTLAGILQGATALLATEGDRRRLRLELVQLRADAEDDDEQAAIVAIADYQQRLGT